MGASFRHWWQRSAVHSALFKFYLIFFFFFPDTVLGTAARRWSVLSADSPTSVCLEGLPSCAKTSCSFFFFSQVVCLLCLMLVFQAAGSHVIRIFFLGGLCPIQEKPYSLKASCSLWPAEGSQALQEREESSAIVLKQILKNYGQGNSV